MRGSIARIIASMAQLGFLGLGIMGAPMARHLLKAGHDVAVWSNTSAKVHEVVKEGKGTACGSPKEVAERADYIFYCVGDSAMARRITTAPGGLIEGIRKGSVTADCSTIAPPVSKEIGAAFTAKGTHFLDAPCTASKPWAQSSTCTVVIVDDTA